MTDRRGPVLLLPIPREWIRHRAARLHGSDAPRRRLSVLAWFLSMVLQVAVVGVLLVPIQPDMVIPKPEPLAIEIPLDQILREDVAPSARARLGVERETPLAQRPSRPELPQAVQQLRQSLSQPEAPEGTTTTAERVRPEPASLQRETPATPVLTKVTPPVQSPPESIPAREEAVPVEAVSVPEIDLTPTREWAEEPMVTTRPGKELSIPRPSAPPALPSRPDLTTLARTQDLATWQPEVPQVETRPEPMRPSSVPARLEVRREMAQPTVDSPPQAVDVPMALARITPPPPKPAPLRPDARVAPQVSAPDRPEIIQVRPTTMVRTPPARLSPTPERSTLVKPAVSAPAEPELAAQLRTPSRAELPPTVTLPKPEIAVDRAVPLPTAEPLSAETEQESPPAPPIARIDTAAPSTTETSEVGENVPQANALDPLVDPLSGTPSRPGRPSGAADLLAGMADAARAEVDDGTQSQQQGRSAFRQYNDPYIDDLPGRLSGIEFADPVGFKEVMNFLLGMIGSGGFTVRDGIVTPGNQLNPRQRMFSDEAAVSVLIESWLDMHHGDIDAACASEMPPKVRELLCPK